MLTYADVFAVLSTGPVVHAVTHGDHISELEGLLEGMLTYADVC
jgi:hypothetical protein